MFNKLAIIQLIILLIINPKIFLNFIIIAITIILLYHGIF